MAGRPPKQPTLDDEWLQHAPRVATYDDSTRSFTETLDRWCFTFRPRPDDVANYDQQHSFVYNRDLVSFLIGGNAAGTTTAAAAKCAEFVLRQQQAPRKDCPFWIISPTFEQSCDVCWQEKLEGNGFIPDCEIDWPRVTWHDKRKGWPSRVPLKPWPTDRGGDPRRNWRLEFKSYEQGRTALQAKSIGGFWFSEQFPWEIFVETLRGCREYMFPGGQFAEFTPIDPDLCVWVEELMDEAKKPKGWEFYRANTQSNRSNLAAGWFDQFFGTVSDEMVGTRMRGDLASFENLIYPNFNRDLHTIAHRQISFPPGVKHAMATDWGSSVEHPQVTVWGYQDGAGVWVIYDEYWSVDQTMIQIDHATEVLKRCRRWGWPVVEDERLPTGLRIDNAEAPLYGLNYADPSRPGELNTWNAYGIPTAPASNAVYPGILHVRDLLKVQPTINSPRLLISSRCVHLISEFRKYRWRRGFRPGGAPALNPTAAKPEPLKKDDDTCDAARYLVYSSDHQSGDTPTSAAHSGERQSRTVQIHRQAARDLSAARRRGLLGE